MILFRLKLSGFWRQPVSLATEVMIRIIVKNNAYQTTGRKEHPALHTHKANPATSHRNWKYKVLVIVEKSTWEAILLLRAELIRLIILENSSGASLPESWWGNSLSYLQQSPKIVTSPVPFRIIGGGTSWDGKRDEEVSEPSTSSISSIQSQQNSYLKRKNELNILKVSDDKKTFKWGWR